MFARTSTTLLSLIVLLVASLTVDAQAGQGADGNPHGWDRRRRCDGTGYNPACGICEGYGGIPFGDSNEEIDLSSCTPVADDPSRNLIQPIWSTRMTMDPYYSIQIGPKLDPFCFQAIPSNTSAGALCYQRQTGSQVYEMGEYNALRFDVNLATKVGNVTSAVIAQGPYLWIVNHLPWYALGVKQCICAEPKQGGDATAAAVYPLQYNWTNRLSHIGLEKIYVEYVRENMTLDHWVYGPHHVWTVPSTGSIIRMWQPFNGLQVMPNGTLPSSIDPAKLDVTPPPECLASSHFTFKIKCNATGYPVKPPPAAPPHAPPPADAGMWRAKTMVPRHAYRGETFAQMSEKLNGWLVEAAGDEGTKPCDEWSVEELQKLQAMLYLLRFPAYDGVYAAASDNRQMMGTIDDMQATWQQLNAAANQSGLVEMHRDGHCHEAIMWFTHHLQEDAKKLLRAQGVVLPLLPSVRHACPAAAPEAALEAHGAVCASYDYKVSCSDCHANVKPEPPAKRYRLLATALELVKKLPQQLAPRPV